MTAGVGQQIVMGGLGRQWPALFPQAQGLRSDAPRT